MKEVGVKKYHLEVQRVTGWKMHPVNLYAKSKADAIELFNKINPSRTARVAIVENGMILTTEKIDISTMKEKAEIDGSFIVTFDGKLEEFEFSEKQLNLFKKYFNQ